MKEKSMKKGKSKKVIIVVAIVVSVSLLSLSFVPFFPKLISSRCPDWDNNRSSIKGFVSCPGESNFWQFAHECIAYKHVDRACKLP